MNGDVSHRAAAGSVAACLAAFAVGDVFARWGLGMVSQRAIMELGNQRILLGLLVPVVAVAAAALPVALARLLPGVVARNGWALAAPGPLVILAALQLGVRPAPVLSETALLLLLEAGAGVALAGAVLAVSAMAGRARAAAALCLAAGIVLSWPVELLLRPRRYEPGALSPYVILTAAMLAVVLAAAVLGARREAPVSPPATAAKPWGPVAAVLSAALLLIAGRLALRAVAEDLRLSPDGLASERRIEFVRELGRYGSAAVAVAVALVLTVYAYRRGRADLARWTVLCLALAPALILGVRDFAAAPLPYAAALVAVPALGCGGLAARYADRWLPWDAAGVCVAACGIGLTTVASRQGPVWMAAASLLTAAGMGFALSAGLVRVLRITSGGAAEVAVSVLLGFATLMLTAPALVNLVLEVTMSAAYSGTPLLLLPGLMVAAALVLLALFGYGRAVDRVRRDIQAEALRPQP